jgi:acyl dehydratase
MPDKATSYEELTPGYKLPPASYQLSASFVSKYLEAVDGAADGFVPPLAIAACAIAAMTTSIPLPPGSVAIHASQELEFFKTVPVGATIECHIGVAQKIARGKMSMLVLDIDVFEKGKDKVQSGRATVALPTS